MTIKVYFNNAAPDMTPPAWRYTAGYDKTTGAVQRALGLTKAGANASVTMAETSTSNTYDMPHGSWTSPPFLRDASLTASDTIGLTYGRQSSASSSFGSLKHIYVMKPDGTVRGVLQSATSTNAWGTSQSNGGWNPSAVTPLAVFAGDRLVFELGVRAINTTSTSRSATIWYGDGGGTDYDVATPNQSGVTTRVGNAELTGPNIETLWTAPAPTVDAGADANVSTNATFTRTATEGGGAPTSRAWTIVSGPAGVGSTISTAAALSWTPTVAGSYVLRYTASNTAGSASDDAAVTAISDYYISAAGSDSNPGTAAAPWQTFGPSYSVVLGAGNTINLRGGDTFSGLLYIAQGGTAPLPIKVRSYGTGRATITNTNNSGLYVYNAPNVEVDNVNFVGGSGATAYDGIAWYAYGAQFPHVRITNCDVTGWRNGVALGGDTGGGWSDVLIDGVDAHGNRDQGIFVYGPAAPAYANTNVTIQNCRAWDNEGNPANTTVNTGSGILVGSTDVGLIQSCAAWSNGSLCTAPEGPVGIWCYDARAVVIQFCLSYGNQTGGTADGDGFDLDIRTTNCLVQYCLAYGNDGAGILVYGGTATAQSGNVVRYNVCVGNARSHDYYYGEITLSGNVGNAAFYHNTLVVQDNGVTSRPPALSIEDGASGATVRNNAFRGGAGVLVRATSAYATTAVLLQGNGYEGGAGIKWGATTYASLAAFRAGIAGQEKVSGADVGFEGSLGLVAPANVPTVTSVANLGAATDYALAASSPARAAGLDLPTLFGVALGGRDYFGTTPTAPYSIGAAEQEAPPGPEPGRWLMAV